MRFTFNQEGTEIPVVHTQAPATIAAAGGEYLVRGGQHAVLEGSWQPDRLAMLRFSSMAAAQAWYDGERYRATRATRATRAGATEFFNMVVIEGVSTAT